MCGLVGTMITIAAAPNPLMVFCFCNFIIAVLILLVGNGSGNGNGSSSSSPSSSSSSPSSSSSSNSTAGDETSSADTTTDHLTMNETVVHESNPAQIIEIEDELNEIVHEKEENYDWIELNGETELGENAEIDEEDEDDDELRRRVEEFIENVQRGWKAEKMGKTLI